MDSEYYELKKVHFGNLFEKDANDNVDLFLQYVAIEINKEMLRKMSELKASVEELSESINSRES